MDETALFAVVLAAGESSRFGSPKQLASHRGESLARIAVLAAESACDQRTVLVTGHEWKKVIAACAPQRGFFVVNPHFRDGMSSSLRSGVSAIRDIAGAVLLMLADQPLVTGDHLGRLIDAWGGSADRIVASSFAETLGPPVIFPSAYFEALCSLEGDRGARPVIESNADTVVRVALGEAAIDIDRPEDLTRLD